MGKTSPDGERPPGGHVGIHRRRVCGDDVDVPLVPPLWTLFSTARQNRVHSRNWLPPPPAPDTATPIGIGAATSAGYAEGKSPARSPGHRCYSAVVAVTDRPPAVVTLESSISAAIWSEIVVDGDRRRRGQGRRRCPGPPLRGPVPPPSALASMVAEIERLPPSHAAGARLFDTALILDGGRHDVRDGVGRKPRPAPAPGGGYAAARN